MEASQETLKIITTPYASVSRDAARKLVDETSLMPGDTVEINARHTDLVTDTFTEELAMSLFKRKLVSKVLVRGTLPGMFSGIKEHAEKEGFTNRVESVPLTHQ